MEVIVAKRCCRCGNVKPMEQYNRDRNRPDGRIAACNACRNDYSKARYHAKKAAKPKPPRRPLTGLPQVEPDGWVVPTHDYTAPDIALRGYSYPVERGPLVPNLGMNVPGLGMAA